MYFVGLDLAWGERNQTGVAVVDADGRLLHVGTAGDDESIVAAIAPYTRRRMRRRHRRALIVKNPRGARARVKWH